jgi:hypothetical protein
MHIRGIFLILDRRNPQGLKRWGDELEERQLPAIIQVDECMVDNNPSLIKGLSDKGFDIGGAYNERPFWNESYGFQYEEMSRIKDKVQSCIDKPMRIFHSKYFAYDEVTLRIADKLAIEYILARGATGAEAVVYKPQEYNIKILSVSNVPSKDMGTGSLCDESLWSRGVTADGFMEMLFSLKAERIILVAQTHLSGRKLHWGNVYKVFLNANVVTWESLDEFSASPLLLPNKEIPVNTEVEYVTPKPKVPLEQEPAYPFED